jgi:uncharacterized membrane protein YbhN (UPF0104 family)
LTGRRIRICAVISAWAATTAAVAIWIRSGAFDSTISTIARIDARAAWLVALAFAISLVATAQAWRLAFAACGARIGGLDACARYGVGSLVNTFVPGRAGDGVRAGLFMRALPAGQGRVFLAGGGFVAVTATQALVNAVLVVVAACLGALPLWPVCFVGGATALAVTLAVVHRRQLGQRVDRLLDAGRALLSEPWTGARVVGWVAIATLARVLAAAEVAASLGIPSPLACALLVTIALDLAGAFPLTPGNLGIASGAIALALESRGIVLSQAVAAGLVFHALETCAGVSFGLASLAFVARVRLPSWVSVRLGAAAGLVLVFASAATLLDEFA